MELKSLIPYYSHNTVKNNTYEHAFTVFTPVYNRADTIHRVFESLNKQTFKDFELLIINDGSKDNSHTVILELIKTANFKVNYVDNEKNQHKLACIVQGVSLAKGEFFLPFDSDDACTEDALEVFYNTYQNLSDEDKTQTCSITCMCKDQYGDLVGKKFESSPFFSSTFNNLLMGKYNEEKWGFTKTEVLKNVNINPLLYSRGYIPEGIVWTLFSKEGFKTCYINDVLRIYYMEDTDNSITSDSIKNRSFGLTVYALCILNRFFKQHFFKNPILFVKQIYYILITSKYLEFNRKDYTKALNSPIVKTLVTIGWPFRSLLKY
ncbi:MAG TPA: glycosyltransferase family 2 protein [Flavobacteriaceae bacterium]|nr:glycosyltransferase family 2 protein [Flavobacteriaceae bacterium]